MDYGTSRNCCSTQEALPCSFLMNSYFSSPSHSVCVSLISPFGVFFPVLIIKCRNGEILYKMTMSLKLSFSPKAMIINI